MNGIEITNNGISNVSRIIVKDVSVNTGTYFDEIYLQNHTVYHVFQLIEIIFYDGSTSQKFISERLDCNENEGVCGIDLNYLNLNNGALVNAMTPTFNGVATSWNPGSDGQVNALLYKSNVLYVGGKFSKIGGLAKKCVGALNTLTGTATSFNYPMDTDVSNEVTSFALTNDTLFIGGNFKNTISKQYGLGAVRLNSTIVDFQNALSSDLNATRLVKTLSLKNNRLYVGGDFDMKFYSNATTLTDKHNFTVIDLKTKYTLNYAYTGGGIVTALAATPDNALYIAEMKDQVSATFNSLVLLNTSGVISWKPGQDGIVNNFCLFAEKVYVGGSFLNINKIFNPYFSTLTNSSKIEIYSVAPLTACINSDITLKGIGFNNVKSVSLGTSNLSFIVKTDSVLVITSPTELSGKVSLYSSSGNVSLFNDSLKIVKLSASSISYIGSAAICTGTTKVLNAQLFKGANYQWKKNGTVITGAISPIYTVNSSGNYSVVTSLGTNCKSETPAVNITVETAPVVTISGPAKICWNGRAMFRASVAYGVWAPVDNTLILASPQGLFRNGVKPATDNYKSGVSYTVSSKLGACTTKVTKNVYVRNVIAPSISISSLKTSVKVNETTTATATTNITAVGTWSSMTTLVSATANANTKTAAVKGLRTGSGANVVYFADDVTTGCRQAGYLAFSVTAASSIVDVPSTDEIQTSTVQLYPNPTNGLVAFNHINGAKSISLFDMTGRMIQTHPLNEGQLTVNFTGVLKGKYLVKIEGEQFFETTSLVIE